MIYELDGGNRKQQKIVDDAMTFVDSCLNLPDNVHVEIVLGNFPSCGCICLDTEDGIAYFLVEINNRHSTEELVIGIFHEMKHVEQTVNNRLDEGKWRGVDHSDTPYFERPWEIEAYAFEEETYSKWTNC